MVRRDGAQGVIVDSRIMSIESHGMYGFCSTFVCTNQVVSDARCNLISTTY